MFSTSKNLFFLILLSLQTSNASNSKLLSQNLLQFFGAFLEPDSAQKMRETSKQWSNVKIYENIFPNESVVAMLRNVNTEEIIWVMPNQEDFVSYLRQNDSAKWNDMFLWLAKNWVELKNKSTNKEFLKVLMQSIVENVDVTFTNRYGYSPLMLAALIDDKDSILALIKRGTDVNQQHNSGWTALHYAAYFGKFDASATLLENNTNIDAATPFGYTPLMEAALNENENMYAFLIEKGADQTLTNINGETALQIARFE